MLAVRLPQELKQRLDTLAKITWRSQSFYVREALTKHIEDLEDVFLAEEALEKFRNSREKAIPLEEMERRFGLDD